MRLWTGRAVIRLISFHPNGAFLSSAPIRETQDVQTGLDKFILDCVALAVEQTTRLGDLVVTRGTRLADDLQLDRFGLLKLALYLEEIFDIELSDEALGRFVTVGDIVRHLTHKYV